MIGHFLFPLSSKILYINYVLCWRYIIHVLSILCWHVFCFPKKTCFIYVKNMSLIQKHSSITLNWCCLCGKGMPFWRIKGVLFMRCISTHKWIWSRLCGRRVMRRHSASLATPTCIWSGWRYMLSRICWTIRRHAKCFVHTLIACFDDFRHQ